MLTALWRLDHHTPLLIVVGISSSTATRFLLGSFCAVNATVILLPIMSEADFKRVLKLFPRSPIWDKQTQRIVDMIRAFVHRNPPPTISFIQQSSLKAGTFRGDFHIVQEEIEAPSEDDARRAFFQAIQDMGRIDHEHPATVPITLEWVGKRKSKSHKEKEEVRESLMRLYEDAETDLTILHVHGGGFL